MQSMPMYTPRIFRRITAYHIVVASPVPWMRCQGRSGCPPSGEMPASDSCRWVAT